MASAGIAAGVGTVEHNSAGSIHCHGGPALQQTCCGFSVHNDRFVKRKADHSGMGILSAGFCDDGRAGLNEGKHAVVCLRHDEDITGLVKLDSFLRSRADAEVGGSAAASNAIIVGFQVRPSANARKLAEKEEIEIRLYSVIYDAINEVKSGIEGMLAPEEKEEITATAEVAETFKISKVGTIAGCLVKEGKLTRTSKVRVIRDGIVVYTGELGSLKRFKDDVKEVVAGLDCGLNIAGYNDIKVGDVVEAYNIVEIKRTL